MTRRQDLQTHMVRYPAALKAKRAYRDALKDAPEVKPAGRHDLERYGWETWRKAQELAEAAGAAHLQNHDAHVAAMIERSRVKAAETIAELATKVSEPRSTVELDTAHPEILNVGRTIKSALIDVPCAP